MRGVALLPSRLADFPSEAGTFNVKAPPYGAVGNNSADDTAAIQAAITAAIAAGGMVCVPPGRYVITDTLTIANTQGFQFLGAGAGYGSTGTYFRWTGAANRPMFLLQDVAHSRFANFIIAATSSVPLLVGMQCETGSGTTVTPTENLFEQIVINGTNGGILKAAWFLPAGAGGDANNDFHCWLNCVAVNYLNCGWLIYHSQSKSNQLINCSARSNAFGKIGVSIGYDIHAGTTNVGGSCFWRGGAMGANSVSDFYNANPTETILIDGLNSERSARLLECGGPSGIVCPTRITNVRSAHDGHLNADGYIIKMNSPGPLVVMGCDFQDKAPGNPVAFQMAGTGAPSARAILDGNFIESTISDIKSLVVMQGAGVGRVEARANTGYNRGTDTYFDFQSIGSMETVRSVSANTTLTYLDRFVLVDASGGARTITLPTAVNRQGARITIKKNETSANAVTVGTTSSQTIDGSTTATIAGSAYGLLRIISDGANWVIV